MARVSRLTFSAYRAAQDAVDAGEGQRSPPLPAQLHPPLPVPVVTLPAGVGAVASGSKIAPASGPGPGPSILVPPGVRATVTPLVAPPQPSSPALPHPKGPFDRFQVGYGGNSYPGFRKLQFRDWANLTVAADLLQCIQVHQGLPSLDVHMHGISTTGILRIEEGYIQTMDKERLYLKENKSKPHCYDVAFEGPAAKTFLGQPPALATWARDWTFKSISGGGTCPYIYIQK